MDFTIVTPSFRQLEYLACCIASVADQEGVTVEHIIQDSTTEGFAEFSKKMSQRWPDRPGYRRTMISEKDFGMYDAINKGLIRGSGGICAYLNCDEQYLPGTLLKVKERLYANRETDLWLGDVIVVDKNGGGMCHRKMVVPSLSHTWTCHFGALTAGIFFWRKIVEQGILFNTSYQMAADAEWYTRILLAKKEVRVLGITTSTFIDSGENLGLSNQAIAERARLDSTAPCLMRCLRPLWIFLHRIKRFLSGAYRPENINWKIYIPGSTTRVDFRAEKLRTTWPGRFWNK